MEEVAELVGIELTGPAARCRRYTNRAAAGHLCCRVRRSRRSSRRICSCGLCQPGTVPLCCCYLADDGSTERFDRLIPCRRLCRQPDHFPRYSRFSTTRGFFCGFAPRRDRAPSQHPPEASSPEPAAAGGVDDGRHRCRRRGCGGWADAHRRVGNAGQRACRGCAGRRRVDCPGSATHR